MPWWNDALYDTCSLITLDKIFMDHPEMETDFRGILAIEVSFRSDQLRKATADRMQPRVICLDAPALPDLTGILAAAHLPRGLAQVDKLIFATAVHHGVTVVTGDKRLAQAVAQKGLYVGNIALALKTLVVSRVLSTAECNAILDDLVKRGDYLLPQNHPQTWATLQRYSYLINRIQ